MYLWRRLLAWFGINEKNQNTEPDPMKYMVVGLGNMGAEYDDTRHNIGFEVLDVLAEQHNVTFKSNTLGDTTMIRHRGRQIYLLKPSTYMNRSGKAVHYWVQKLKIQRPNLLILVDDLNIELGTLRLRAKGKDGGHNGLKSIDQYAGGNNYARMRLGIGSDFHKGQQVNFVLGKWTNEELETKNKLIKRAAEAVLSYCFAGPQNTMNKFNG